jgi:flagellar hook-basal body complex protein FliE
VSISPITGSGFISGLTNVASAGGSAGADGVQGTGKGFGDMVSKAIDNVQQTQGTADDLATKAATGDLTDVHDYMLAATQASVTTELTVAVRNKAVEAFNDIMRMQV